MRIGRALVLVVAWGLLAGCASAGERTAAVCRDVAEQVGALASVQGADTATQIVPLLDAQLRAAGDGRNGIAEIVPGEAERAGHDALLADWDALVASMRELRDAWEDPCRFNPCRLGSDLVIALDLAARSARLDEAADALRGTAERVGAPECGGVPWRGGRE